MHKQLADNSSAQSIARPQAQIIRLKETTEYNLLVRMMTPLFL